MLHGEVREANRDGMQGSTSTRLEEHADRHNGQIRTLLEGIGRPIGHIQLLIAAYAGALGTTLLTHNAD